MATTRGAGLPGRQAAPQATHLRAVVRSRAASQPHAPALCAPDRPALTYADLDAHLDAVSRGLHGAGIRPGDRVALALPNGPELAVALLAVAAWTAAAPLDPAGRAGDFDHFLVTMQARAVVVEAGSDTAAAAVARARGIDVLELSPVPGAPAGAFELRTPAGPPQQPDAGEPDDVALLLHTSGTTGRPKLVRLTHANVCTSAANIADSLRLRAEDRCLGVLPLFHGHGIMSGLLATLVAGASVVCTPGFDAQRFAEWMRVFAPTWLTAVPTVHREVVRVAAADPRVARASRLRFVRSASAPLPPDLRDALEETFGVPAIDSYGMTEAASIITSNPLPPAPRKPGSVGTSIGGEVAILDRDGEPLPAGTAGEICLRGPTVTAGYERDEEATAAAFTRGWFRTGDQGYLDADGFLFLTGRIKDLINRGGTNIAPAEVEAALVGHPGVAEAVAFPLEHPTLGEDVAAAVVGRGDPPPAPEALRAFAAGTLATHKVPRRILLVDDIPRGPTGKIQRRHLAAQLALTDQPDFVAPQTSAQGVVAAAWAEVLGVERVGVDDHFFDLGGDSLLMARVQQRLRESAGIELTLVELFTYPTVRALAGHLSRPPEPAPAAGSAGDGEGERVRDGRSRLLQQRSRRRSGGR